MGQERCRDGELAECRIIRLGGREAVGIFLGDETGRDPALAPARMRHKCGEERDVVADAFEFETVERLGHGIDGGEPVGRVGAELGDHRVVEHRDLRALGNAGIVPERHAVDIADLGGRAVAGQAADRGQEVAVGILGIEPAFDRPAVDGHVILRQRQLLTRGDADHLLDQVDAGDQFGDRMLDLQTGVHL